MSIKFESVALTIVCLWFGTAAMAAEGWRLIATSVYYGDVTITLANKELFPESKDASILITAPNYTLTLFNRDSKKFITESVQEFKKRQGGDIEHNDCIIKKGQSGIICGAEATQYFLYYPRNGKLRLDYEFWATKDKRVDPRMAEVCSIFCSIKPGYGLPIKILGRKKGTAPINSGQLEPILESVSLKKVEVDLKTFAVPSGFKRARSEMELFLTDDSKGADNDFGQIFKK